MEFLWEAFTRKATHLLDVYLHQTGISIVRSLPLGTNNTATRRICDCLETMEFYNEPVVSVSHFRGEIVNNLLTIKN